MNDFARLQLAIVICIAMIALCLVLLFTGCTEKQEPWTVEQQCQYYRIWAKWPEKGECE